MLKLIPTDGNAMNRKMRVKSILVSLLASLAVATLAHSSGEQKLRPESIVRFTVGGPACLDMSDLHELFSRSLRGEETKAEAMIAEHGGGCVMLSSTTRYKVISVGPDLGQGFSLLEIVGEDIIAGQGAWAIGLGAIVVEKENK